MHKAIKKNITEYNDGIYNFIVDLIDVSYISMA